jgi:hypothetical protein
MHIKLTGEWWMVQRNHQKSLVLFQYSIIGRTMQLLYCVQQEVTKRCRLSWLSNSALVYEPKYKYKYKYK